MKKIAIVLFVASAALAGCGKKKAPAAPAGGDTMGSAAPAEAGSDAAGSDATAPAGGEAGGEGAGSAM